MDVYRDKRMPQVEQFQYPAIIHGDHYIELTRKSMGWVSDDEAHMPALFDTRGDVLYCRRCKVRIPRRTMLAYKGLIDLMRAGDDEGTHPGLSRHFFRRPTTN